MGGEDPAKLSWYALKVRSRGEEAVKTQLAGKGYDLFLPTLTESRKYTDRIKKVEVAVFPGYLFCRLDPEHRLPILKTPGVDYVVGRGKLPEPIPEEEISALQKALSSGLTLQPWPYLTVGERVLIQFGSMMGVEGILVGTKGQERLVLSVTLLQRSVSVEIDRAWVRPLGSAQSGPCRP